MNSTPTDDSTPVDPAPELAPELAADAAAERLRRAVAADAPELAPELVATAASRKTPRLVNHGRTTRVASASIVAVAAVAAGSLVIANPFAPRAPLFTAAASAPS